MSFFLLQAGLFVALILIIGILTKASRKTRSYVVLFLPIAALTFAVLTTSDYTDRTFLYVMLFGIVTVSFLVRSVLQRSSSQ